MKKLTFGNIIIKTALKSFSAGEKNMANFYCEYCGQKYTSVQSLTANKCMRHPNGSFKGKHKLYEGNEKSQYVCKYCGQKYSSLSSLTANKCLRHPSGNFQGKHSPAL